MTEPSDRIPRRPTSSARARGPLVLVVEDDEAMRELHASVLAAAGFMVLEADSGASGVEKALQFGPQAIVLDLMLPGIDGFKVARRLRTDDRTRDVAIVALTALASKRSEDLALAAGCDAFMTKPVSPAALTGEILRLIAQRTRASRTDLSRVLRGL